MQLESEQPLSFDFAYTLLMNAYLIPDTRTQYVVSQIL